MKPSDKILASAVKRGEMTKDTVISAILDYLDEEYEQNACNRGEHKYEQENNLNVCQKCNVVGVL